MDNPISKLSLSEIIKLARSTNPSPKEFRTMQNNHSIISEWCKVNKIAPGVEVVQVQDIYKNFTDWATASNIQNIPHLKDFGRILKTMFNKCFKRVGNGKRRICYYINQKF